MPPNANVQQVQNGARGSRRVARFFAGHELREHGFSEAFEHRRRTGKAHFATLGEGPEQIVLAHHGEKFARGVIDASGPTRRVDRSRGYGQRYCRFRESFRGHVAPTPEDREKMKRIRIALALAAAAGVGGCSHADQRTSMEREGAAVAVGVVAAHDEPLPVIYRASGTVRGRNTTVLTSKTTAYVRAVRVRSGDRVVAGQPLVQLEANDVRATVARGRAGLEQSTEAKVEAESALEAARAAATVAKSSYERTAHLLKVNAISQHEFDEAEARWRSAAAQERMANARIRAVGSSMDQAKAVLGEAQATLGYADIVAPFAGRVLERRVDPGALAGPGTPLLVIADEGMLRVEAAVDESRADDVGVGDEAEVEIEGMPRSVTSKVSEIVPNVDVASRSFIVKLDLPPDAGARHPGTFARVAFRVGTRPRLVVPAGALTSFGALDRVFVIEDTHARLRMITRGATHGAWTEILSGLSASERVVASPPPDLRDGSLVEVRP